KQAPCKRRLFSWMESPGTPLYTPGALPKASLRGLQLQQLADLERPPCPGVIASSRSHAHRSAASVSSAASRRSVADDGPASTRRRRAQAAAARDRHRGNPLALAAADP